MKEILDTATRTKYNNYNSRKSEVRTMQALNMSMMMPQLPSRFAA